MKQIVVPVDFSADSVRAVQKAVFMAKKMVAEIKLIHVIRSKSLSSIFSSSNGVAGPEEIEAKFKELIQNVEHAGVPMEYTIVKGNVPKEISKYVESISANLIVMGTHGASGFEEFWMGSNAYKVVNSADCPVLTLRSSSEKMDIKKIVLPIDTTQYTRQKVPFTMDLASYFGAEIHVVAVCIDETEEFVIKLTNYMGQVARFLKKHNIECVTEFLVGDNPTTMTLDYAKKIDADLISIMTEQETSFLYMFLGAYAQQMVNHSPIPVLTMHRNPMLEGDVAIM